MYRLAAHGMGIALVFNRSDTQWFQNTVRYADAVCFIEGRVYFVPGEGGRSGTPSAGSILVAFGQNNVEALNRSGLGLMMKPERSLE